MSHQEKQEVFDNFSKENHNEKFEEFLMYTLFEVVNGEISKSKAVGEITELVFAACDQVQEQQQKRIADNATIDGSEYSRCGCVINENSINNPENLIK